MKFRPMAIVALALLAVMCGGVAAMLYNLAVQALEWWDQ